MLFVVISTENKAIARIKRVWEMYIIFVLLLYNICITICLFIVALLPVVVAVHTVHPRSPVFLSWER